MTKVILQLKQLSDLTCKNLEKRLQSHYELYLDAAYVLQCAVFVLVRNAFSTENFSCLAKESICTILLEHDPAALTSVRHLCVYFRSYFSDDEWKKVKARLFNNEQEYLKITEETRLHSENLQPMLYSGKREAAELMNIVTTYRDEAGKKHRWTLKNVDPCYSVQETTELLSILNTLTIFQKEDGTRRFTELVRYVYHPTTPIYDSESEEQIAKTQEQPVEAQNIVEEMKPVNQERTEPAPTEKQPADTTVNTSSKGSNEQARTKAQTEAAPSPDESSSPEPDTKQPPKDPDTQKNSDIKDQVKNRLMGNLPGWHGETKKKKKKNKKPKNSGKKKKGRKKK
ncbi:hypothetical protein JZO70_02570 [Enterococcus sp. 669A]|uniref:Uncharacterized protein n=1 Tax=Candidatus Enterococcus moelleringii TaxID=2815325 RepID=A0ABS3L625_9ENTE|nr:hypothetical protein [Enterococcus sp. 669A]MBO1305030.1 hypothetical protein [Enterococcus sp. 669A]